MEVKSTIGNGMPPGDAALTRATQMTASDRITADWTAWSTAWAAVVVGAGWGVATVAFEFRFGHYVNGDSWQTLCAAYNLTGGRLWTLDVLLIAAAPALVRARRLYRSFGDRSRKVARL
jgi:hypothetical protein